MKGFLILVLGLIVGVVVGYFALVFNGGPGGNLNLPMAEHTLSILKRDDRVVVLPEEFGFVIYRFTPQQLKLIDGQREARRADPPDNAEDPAAPADATAEELERMLPPVALAVIDGRARLHHVVEVHREYLAVRRHVVTQRLPASKIESIQIYSDTAPPMVDE